MSKRLLAGLGALAMVVSMAAPSVTLARETKHEKLKETVAIDGKGDKDGLARFESEDRGRKHKFVTGKVTAISATSITILTPGTAPVANTNTTNTNSDSKPKALPGTSYTFAITSATHYVRKYKGTASWNEIMLGDTVKVWADKLVDGTAKLIWDTSIWYSEVKGVVSNLNVTGMALTLTVTMKGVEYNTTVKMDSATTYLMKDGTAKAITDLANGQTIKLRGSWNSVGKYLLAKRIVIMPAI